MPPRRQTALWVWFEGGRGRQAWLARKLHYSVDSMRNWSRGRGCPDLEQAFLIERLTEGAVPVVSWLDPERMKLLIRGHKIPARYQRVA